MTLKGLQDKGFDLEWPESDNKLGLSVSLISVDPGKVSPLGFIHCAFDKAWL